MEKLNRFWNIVEDEFTVARNKHFEGMFTTGSGYMSVRGSLEEGLLDDPQDEEYMRMPANVTLEKPRQQKSKWGTFIPGIMGPHPLLKEEIINLPWFLGIQLWFAGERLTLEESLITNYTRYLSLKDGILHRQFTWQTNSGAKLDVYFKRFISLKQPNLSVQSLKIKILAGKGTLKVKAGLDANVRTNGFNHYVDINTKQNEDLISLMVNTNGGNQIAEISQLKSTRLIDWDVIEENNQISFITEKTVKTGIELNLLKLTAVATDRDLDIKSYQGNPYPKSIDTLTKARNSGWDELYQEHRECWEQKWAAADMKIEGDDFAQRALRFSLYHLLRSNNRDDPRVAVCAKGFAGEAYFGRFFWDTEMYLLPFFLYTDVKAARNLVLFRYHTLSGAKENARNYGYSGARYPWESSISGLEQCPNWQYADHEIHVTADVVYGLWHYYQATADAQFMYDYGSEIMVETCRYWIERIDQDKSTGESNLLGVMGPDEYLPFTRNNAFTNQLVKFNLLTTVSFLQNLRKTDLNGYLKLEERLKFTEAELTLFEEVGSALKIPCDQNRNLILQSEDFESFADIDFEQVWEDRSKPFGQFVSQERMYRSKCLKQADVLALMLLFPGQFSAEQIQLAYQYYEPITTHDSSLSPSVHSIICSWLDYKKEAIDFFNQAAGIDFKNAAEGIHIANAGGNWLMVVRGFAGIKNVLQSDVLEINPHLPVDWESLSFPILWKGSPVELTLTQELITVKNKGEEPLKVKIRSDNYLIQPGDKIEAKNERV